jgi:hypothetical protein
MSNFYGKSNTFALTPCGATGRLGPSTLTYPSQLVNTLFTVSNGIQTWIVPSSGYYRVVAAGAKGGIGADAGSATILINGVIVSTTCYFPSSTQVNMIVGQAGEDTNAHGTGGGGGTFVYTGTLGRASLILSAGGGGGHQYAQTANSSAISTTMSAASFGGSGTNGASGSNGDGGRGGAAVGGGSAPGGDAASSTAGAGGQGANVTVHTNSAGGGGGQGWRNINQVGANPYGGAAPPTRIRVGMANGGFGGGGGGGSGWSGPGTGGGGGFSGGGGGDGGSGTGGGGGSFDINGINGNASVITTEGTVGFNNGHGFVKITPIQPLVSGGLNIFYDAYNPTSYTSNSGSTWTNIVGATNATLVSSPLFAENYIYFNGTTQYATIPSVEGVTDMSTSNDYSIGMWVWISSTQQDTSRTDNSIIDKWDETGAYPYSLRYVRAPRTIGFYVHNGTTGISAIGPSNCLVPESWNHIVGTMDNTNKVIGLYINGVVVSQNTGSNATITGTINNATAVNIMRRGNNVAYCTGRTGQIAFYNRVLLAPEVRFHFENTREIYKVRPPLDGLNRDSRAAMNGAYSLRLLSSTYTGATVNVRRGSDNATSDFFASVGGYLGTSYGGRGTTLESWLNGAVGYVATWYDQSGRGNHATQATQGSQPIINTSNSFIDFGAYTQANAWLQIPSGTVPLTSSQYTIAFRHGVINATTLSSGGIVVGAGTQTNNQDGSVLLTTTGYRDNWFSNDLLFGTVTTNSRVVTTWNGTTRTGYVNGAQASSAAASGRNTATGTQYIGSSAGASGSKLNGELYYLYVFNSSLNDLNRFTMEEYARWLPNMNLTLQNWYAADPQNVVYSTGITISAWRDLSGYNRTATQPTTAAQPSLAISSLNGQPMVNFGNVNGVLMNVPSVNTTTFTIALVAQFTTLDAILQDLFITTGAYNRSGFVNLVAIQNTRNLSFTVFGATNPTGFAFTDSTPFIMVITGSISGGNSVCTVFANGTQVSTGPSISVSTYLLASLNIGGWDQDGTRTMNGGISEMLIYNTVLSTTDRQKLEGYLSHKWWRDGSVLPGGHPHKTGPPLV